MKRNDLLRLLKAAGFEFQEGGRHTLVFRNGIMVTQVPRHREVNELTAKKILKDAGIK